MRCPACEGNRADCPECGGMGGVQIEGCPKAQVPGEIIELIEVAHDAKKRIFPVAGGTYDQAAGLMPAIRHIWRETAEYEQPNASTD